MTASYHGNRMLWCQPLKYAKTVSTFKWANSSLNSPINCLNLAWQAPYITTVLVVVNHNLHFEKFKVREIENSNPLYILTYLHPPSLHSALWSIKNQNGAKKNTRLFFKWYFWSILIQYKYRGIFFFLQKVVYVQITESTLVVIKEL